MRINQTPARGMARAISEGSAGWSMHTPASTSTRSSLLPTTPPFRPAQRDVFWTGSSNTPSTQYASPVTPATSARSSPWNGERDPYIMGTPQSAKHRSLPSPVKITPGYAASAGWSSPYGSAASSMSRRMSDTSGISRYENGQNWEAYDRKRVPVQNIVRPEMIISGKSGVESCGHAHSSQGWILELQSWSKMFQWATIFSTMPELSSHERAEQAHTQRARGDSCFCQYCFISLCACF